MRNKLRTALFLASFLLLANVPYVRAALTESQIQSVLSTLTSFGVDSDTLSKVESILERATTSADAISTQDGCGSGKTYSTTTGKRCSGSRASSSSAVPACLTITYEMSLGSTDFRTNGEVSKLQRFLGGQVTGYFGTATQELVRQWQSARGIQPTGYVGSQTRVALASCVTAEKRLTTARDTSGDEEDAEDNDNVDETDDNNRLTFRASPTSGTAPLSVTFSNRVGGPIQGALVIRYGDGSSDPADRCLGAGAALDSCGSPGTNMHTYTAAGTYMAQLVNVSCIGTGCESVWGSATIMVRASAGGKCGMNSFSVSSRCTNEGYSAASVQCYDGHTEELGGLDASCKSSDEWRAEASAVCANHCYSY